MAAAPILMTVEDYFATPETLRPAELAFGVLRVADAPAPRHQSVVFQLSLALEKHVRERDLGRIWISPLDVVLDADKALIVQPDLMFISKERAPIVRDRVRGAPDLVIEVLSPRPRIGKLSEHRRWFAEYGARERWEVHQIRRAVTVTRFEDGRIADEQMFGERAAIQSGVLPDFTLSLADILS